MTIPCTTSTQERTGPSGSMRPWTPALFWKIFMPSWNCIHQHIPAPVNIFRRFLQKLPDPAHQLRSGFLCHLPCIRHTRIIKGNIEISIVFQHAAVRKHRKRLRHLPFASEGSSPAEPGLPLPPAFFLKKFFRICHSKPGPLTRSFLARSNASSRTDASSRAPMRISPYVPVGSIP